MFIQSFTCVIISAGYLFFTGNLRNTIDKMLFNKLTIISPIFIFLGMLFTNFGLMQEVNYLLFNMIKSSKCLAVMLLTFFFPVKGVNNTLSRKELIYGFIITFGLVIFNLSVRMTFLI